jgi:hypothetical protein
MEKLASNNTWCSKKHIASFFGMYSAGTMIQASHGKIVLGEWWAKAKQEVFWCFMTAKKQEIECCPV